MLSVVDVDIAVDKAVVETEVVVVDDDATDSLKPTDKNKRLKVAKNE